MIDFSEHFKNLGGSAIRYKGRTLVMMDRIHLTWPSTILRCRRISTCSEWKQGVGLNTNGILVFPTGAKGHSIVLWENTSPDDFSFVCNSRDGILEVKNVWDTGNGTVESWINGAAMWIEEIPNGWRYHCNDGHFDDDLNDIIFEIVVVGPVQTKK